MNRNLKQLLYLVLAFVAALVGCGGGNDSQSVIPPVPGQDAGEDPDDAGNEGIEPDATCAMSLGEKCSPDGRVDECTGFLCYCGKWVDPNSPYNNAPCVEEDAGQDADVPDSEAGSDAAEDVVEPDADADVDPPDVVTPQEICGNGEDDNGNGLADCQDPACSGEAACQPEVCDGVDNNGNSQVDEGFQCKQGQSATCQTSCGSFGQMQCQNDCTWSACEPPAEVCGNGVDDNCNLAVDCNDAACINLPACNPCEPPVVGTGCGNLGEFSECDPSIRCDCNFTWNYITSGNYTCFTVEVCNGYDDNGNNQADESFTCVKNSMQNCVTSCGSTGAQICNNSCEWSVCAPPAEICGNGVDDDCNGLSGCSDPVCSGLLSCQDEVCDGADNNGNYQIDEGFACWLGQPDATCQTSCGSVGYKQCQSNCAWGTCVALENCYSGGDEDCDGQANCADSDCQDLPMCQPENCTNGVDDNGNSLVDCADPGCSSAPNCQPENCTNGVDDNGNSLVDCADPDCASEVACHDFGTCAVQSPSGSGYECGTYTQDNVPSAIYQIRSGCANSLNDQWAIGGTWNDVKAVRTGNTIWSEVSLPFGGKVNKGGENVLCLGQNRTYLMYNDYDGGILLNWNGSSFTRIMESALNGYNAAALWGSSETDLWVAARHDDNVEDVRVFHWNGSTATSTSVNPFMPNSWLPLAMWGASSDDIYLVGYSYNMSDIPNNAYWHGVIMHWDGKTWAQVQTSSSVKYLGAVHGSGSCDVMATGWNEGGAEDIGATYQRNGSSWDLETYDSVNLVASVHKSSAFSFQLQAKETVGSSGQIWLGTPNGTSVSWENNFSFSSEGSEFFSAGATWSVPGTSVVMTAGDGYHGAQDPNGVGTYAFIFRSNCQ